jgi:membrane-associated phospholipid phosphatase
MEALLAWGIDFIVWIQAFSSPFLDGVFKAITFLGDEKFYLILLPLIFWCLNKGLGAKLVFLFLFSAYANNSLKDIFRAPRPCQFAPDKVKAIGECEGYGFPSGHAQGTGVVWGFLSSQVRKGWLWVLGIATPLLVALSRVYLGEHFPHDVIGGLIIAVLFVLLYTWLLPSATTRIGELSLISKLALAALVPLALVFIHPTKDTSASMGTLLGMGVGLTLEGEFVRFSSGGVIWKRMLRFLLGFVITFGLYFGLSEALPTGLHFRFLRYGLIGLWGSFFAPLVFVKTKLAQQVS